MQKDVDAGTFVSPLLCTPHDYKSSSARSAIPEARLLFPWLFYPQVTSKTPKLYLLQPPEHC